MVTEQEQLTGNDEVAGQAERQRGNNKYHHDEDSYHLLVESVKDYGIFLLDPEGHISTWNAGAERIKGYTAKEIIGQHFSRFYPPEDVASRKPQIMLEVAKAEGRCIDEGWRVRKDGSQFWAFVVITALYDQEGNLRGFGKVTRDMTEQKQAEEEIRRLNVELEERVAKRTAQLEAANKELEAFSYSVSHDLRAPLRAVNGFARILEEDFAAELPEEARAHLGVIQNSAQQMGQLIDDLLAFSRLSRQSLSKQQVNMTALVRQVLQELHDEIGDRQVEVAVADLPNCYADRSLLKQLLFNLLANAVKFTRHREVARIDVHGEQQEDELIYSVKDNGGGFDMRHANKLFGVFQRLHLAEEYEGTGVGLALVQRIALRHGGRVWAEGEVGQGATFYVALPVEQDQADDQ